MIKKIKLTCQIAAQFCTEDVILKFRPTLFDTTFYIQDHLIDKETVPGEKYFYDNEKVY